MPSTNSDRARRRLIALTVLLLALPGQGASLFQFDVWMRQIDKQSTDLQHALMEAEGAPRARERAESLQTLYGSMAAFLDGIDRKEAAAWAREDADRSLQAMRAIDAGDLSRASDLAVRVRQACMQCHDKYRPIAE